MYSSQNQVSNGRGTQEAFVIFNPSENVKSSFFDVARRLQCLGLHCLHFVRMCFYTTTDNFLHSYSRNMKFCASTTCFTGLR
jgi:hypothetical protein